MKANWPNILKSFVHGIRLSFVSFVKKESIS
jgi:hypothetical protein